MAKLFARFLSSVGLGGLLDVFAVGRDLEDQGNLLREPGDNAS